MSTKLQELLQKQATSNLFDGEGDDANDGQFYYTGGLESLLAGIARAAVADGVSARTVMKMLVSTAFGVLPSPAEIEELERDAAAIRATNSHH